MFVIYFVCLEIGAKKWDKTTLNWSYKIAY